MSKNRANVEFGSEVDEVIEKFFEEIKLTAPLNHRNVINCLGGSWGSGEEAGAVSAGVCIVLEFAARGDLTNFIESEKKQGGGWNVTSKMITGIAKGMAYLHSRKASLMHRDLKPENILVNAALDAKVSALGWLGWMDGGMDGGREGGREQKCNQQDLLLLTPLC